MAVVSVATLVAVTVQCRVDCFFHALINGGGAAKVSSTLFGQTIRQVAGAALTVHRLALGRQAKSFFGALMGLDLRAHDSISWWGVIHFRPGRTRMGSRSLATGGQIRKRVRDAKAQENLGFAYFTTFNSSFI